MRVLLAGATGILGRSTVPRLVEAGHDVVAVSRRPERDATLEAAGATPVRLDLFDREAVARRAAATDAVVNLATHIPPMPAMLRSRAWRENDRLRADASRILADAALRAGGRLVQESFAPAYRDGGSGWITEEHPIEAGANTRTVPDAEASAQLVTDRGGTGVVLRFGLLYGPGRRQSQAWLDAAARGRLMLPGPADRYTTMVHVSDAATAVLAALRVPPGAYNVVEDEPLTRETHAAVLAELLGRERLRPLPAWLGRLPVLRAIARSQRISNARLRRASDWRPAAPSVREGWRLILGERPGTS